jgi:uncharacterized LabA/DUF88 family protein
MRSTHRKKIGLYVDVQNIYYTTREVYNRQFNYRKLWEQVTGVGEIVVANAYAINRGVSDQERFQSALRHIGFEVKLKPFISRKDGSAKGDWDVGITIDAIKDAAELDHIILLSGDGDFELLINFLHETHDILFDVYGVSSLTANSLRFAADKFYEIDERLLL